MMETFDSIVKKVQQLNEVETRSFFEKAVKLQEETGEFASEALRFVGKERISKKGTASTTNLCEEAADMIIVTLSYIFDGLKSAGCTQDDLLGAITNKLPKWERQLAEEHAQDELSSEWYPYCGMQIVEVRPYLVHTIKNVEDGEIVLYNKDLNEHHTVTFEEIYDIQQYRPFEVYDVVLQDAELDNVLDDINDLIRSKGMCPQVGCRGCVIRYIGFGTVCTKGTNLYRAQKLKEIILKRQKELTDEQF